MSAILDLPANLKATREGSILVAHCAQCGKEQYLPAGSCLRCGSEELTVSAHSGHGVLYSWSVTGVAFEPEIASEVPYIVAVILLTGGAKLWARLVGMDPASELLRADLPVQLDTKLTSERGYLVFRPSDAAGSSTAAAQVR